MQFKIKKTITQVTVLSALLPTLPWLAAEAYAHERPGPASKLDPATALKRGQYAYDSYGRVVRTTVTGECVVTTFWSPETSTQECHPNLFAAPMQPAPRAAAAPPTPSEYEAAQYSEPPDYEPPTYVEPAAAAAPEVADFAGEGDPPDMLPIPPADSFAADADDERMGEPVMFYDEDGAVAADDTILAVTEYGDDDSGIRPDDGIVARQYYGDEGVAADDGIVARQYYGDEGVADDDGIVARQVYEDAGADADDGIVARQFYDDDAAVADDGILGREEFDSFTDEPEEVVQDDEGGFPEFVDDTVEPADEAVADSTFSDDTVEPADEAVADSTFSDDTVEPADEAVADSTFSDDAVEPADEAVAAPTFSDDTVEEEEGGAEAEMAQFEEEAREPEELVSEPTIYPEEEGIEESVAQAEEPAPTPTPEPKPVVLPVTITLEAEALFDFDRSLVRSNDRLKLDNLADGLQGVDYDTIVVVGHADRIGTRTYNQRLSERRANTVKAYLVKKGISDERIQTEGRGEFEPATDAQTCQGLRKQGLIDCLQPDRRVEVTVTGQKPRE